ncbi:TolB, C-terminal domain-containing protein [Delitschia confertaspora ATCC 74209]|uniref:TolB, C-terminal domain-containing protein n=1 Tax=Delitschia confertaspora ATCC 74209 TaxID=1513339 RepID=A0A9P4JQ12_9PLEO|nr:TolB, C-terminal domain-containing protein [Delitschia confertaspora ATCC 74209]
MEVSHQFKATSLSVPSPTGTHIASLSGSRLQIRALSTQEVTHSIVLPSSQDLRASQIRWSPPVIQPSTTSLLSTPDRKRRSVLPPQSNRVLVADEENTRVYDLRDEKWSAVINNGSGGMGKNVHVEFGRTEDEVLVWSDFASKITVWCLNKGRTVEIKDPKFPGKEGKGWGFRACANGAGGVLALLCRSMGQDILLLLAPRSYNVLRKVELATVDAQGVRWSRDGRWIAVWDSPGAGYKVYVYTADGHLYRTVGGDLAEGDIEGLGVKSVEWVPGNQYLAVGGWDRRVRMFGCKTFSPSVTLSHTPTIEIPATPVFTEQVSSTGTRSYTLTPQPVAPPIATTTPNDTVPKKGISLINFSCDGKIAATRDDSAPTTVWIWDLQALRPKAICIQHAPVKSLTWHPTNPSLLLIQCTHDVPIIYLWSAASSQSQSQQLSSVSLSISPPQILTLTANLAKPAGTATAKWNAKWISTDPDLKSVLLFGHQQGYDGGEESEDSLYEILTGKKEVPRLEVDDWAEVAAEEDSTVGFDDTFREKRKEREAQSEQSEFFESGMDEMF